MFTVLKDNLNVFLSKIKNYKETLISIFVYDTLRVV
jgi:hypothetical protein